MYYPQAVKTDGTIQSDLRSDETNTFKANVKNMQLNIYRIQWNRMLRQIWSHHIGSTSLISPLIFGKYIASVNVVPLICSIRRTCFSNIFAVWHFLYSPIFLLRCKVKEFTKAGPEAEVPNFEPILPRLLPLSQLLLWLGNKCYFLSRASHVQQLSLLTQWRAASSCTWQPLFSINPHIWHFWTLNYSMLVGFPFLLTSLPFLL